MSIDDHSGRNLNPGTIQKPASCEYIMGSLNIFITGAAGSGKTYLACALAMEAMKGGCAVNSSNQNRNTCLFFVFLLLAGTANLFSRTAIPQLDTLMACVNYVIYIGLLLFWMEAVRVRLLPSVARKRILSAAGILVLFFLIRIFKYRFAMSVIPMRFAVYAYYIPQMLVPALFLSVCIHIRRDMNKESKRNEYRLLLPAAFLSLLVMTNDLHFLVYVPLIDLSDFTVATGTYRYGPVFYLLQAWMILTSISGLVILFRKAGQLPKKAVFLLAEDIILWLGLVLMDLLVMHRVPGGRNMFLIPEIHIFGMLGIFEICIRCRLIPCNENYSGFFRKLQIPMLITDRAYQTVYHTEAVFHADHHDLRTAVKEPVYLGPDRKLCGKQIAAGYTFWTEDESAVHRVQTRLQEANEMIGQENDLIRAETEQKEKDAYLQSRHRIYHEIAEELYPCQKRITQILDEAHPGSESFREKIALVSVLNSYVKRKTNLLLLATGNETLSLEELFLALQESAGYLSLAGLKTTANVTSGGQLSSACIIALYDAFQQIALQLLGKASSLMVTWNAGTLRLAAQTDREPDRKEIPLPVTFRRIDDVLYMDVTAGKDGETV